MNVGEAPLKIVDYGYL